MPLTTSLRLGSALLHATSLAICWSAFLSLDDLSAINGLDVHLEYGGHYQFLTVCALRATQITMAVALLHDVLALPELGTLKSILSVAVLPVETLVTMLYWTVLAIDPDLLVPPRLTDDPNNPGQVIKESIRLPLSADLAMHAAPAIFLLGDFLLVSPPFPKKVRPAFVSGIATVAYCVWCERCAAVNGHYPYPLLGLLDLWPRLALYAGCSITMVLVLGAVRTIHSALDLRYKRVWDQTVAESATARVKPVSEKQS